MSVKIPVAKLPELIQEHLDGKPHRYSFVRLRTTQNVTKASRTDKKNGVIKTLTESFEHPAGVEIVAILKETEGMYSFNLDYENKVNTNLDKEGFEKNFETGSLPWGEWVEGSKCLITHKGEYYCRMYPNFDTAMAQSLRDSKYFFLYSDGVEVELTEEQLAKAKIDFLDKEKEKKPITESFDEFKPIVNTTKITSIQEIRIDGEVYIIKY